MTAIGYSDFFLFLFGVVVFVVQIDAIVADGVQRQQQTWAESLQKQREKNAELQKLHLEELQRLESTESRIQCTEDPTGEDSDPH